jgi:hypothetical protein
MMSRRFRRANTLPGLWQRTTRRQREWWQEAQEQGLGNSETIDELYGEGAEVNEL